MYVQQNFTDKIYQLVISLEALNLYTHDELNHNYYYVYAMKKMLFIKWHNHLNHYHNTSLYTLHSEHTFSLINYIYDIAKESHIQKIAFNILNNYTRAFYCTATLQYIKRYQYICKNMQTYYNTYSHYDSINIEELAIINLYIITQVKNIYGIYCLIKYLE